MNSKKIKALLPALLLLVAWMPLSAQTQLLNEDFSLGSPPTNWTTSQAVGSVGFEFGSTNALGSQFFPIPAGTRCAASNDDANDAQGGTQNDASEDRLITPSLDLSIIALPRLVFDVFNPEEYESDGTVEISTDGGNNWITLWDIPATTGWETITVDLSIWGSQTVNIAFRHNDNGEWASGLAIDNVIVEEPLADDILVSPIEFPTFQPITRSNLDIDVKNNGLNTVTSFDVHFQLNDGSVIDESVTGVAVPPGNSYNHTFSEILDLSNPDLYVLRVWADNPNGNTDSNPGNNEFQASITTISSIPDKFVLLEEFSGAWCQYCPDGAYRLEQILMSNPFVIGATVHNGDAMEIPDGATIDGAFGSGWPAGMIDRAIIGSEPEVRQSRTSWAASCEARDDMAVPVGLSISNSFDAGTRELTVDLTATFYGPVVDDYRLNVMILEDSVTGTGSGYNQVNFYNNVGGHPYEGAGNPIVGFQHMHTVREYMGGSWGDGTTIPDTTVADFPYTKQFTMTLPNGWKEQHITLVGFVSEYGPNAETDREILNSVEVDLNASKSIDTTKVELPPIGVGINEVAANASILGVYPNPAQNQVFLNVQINKADEMTLHITNMLGQTMNRMNVVNAGLGVNRITINTANLASGVYLLSLETGDQVVTERVVISK